MAKLLIYSARLPVSRRVDREAYGARLESVCTVTPYRGFESLTLRH